MLYYLYFFLLIITALSDKQVNSAPNPSPSSSSRKNSPRKSPESDSQLNEVFDQIGNLPYVPEWAKTDHPYDTKASTTTTSSNYNQSGNIIASVDTQTSHSERPRSRSRSPPPSIRGGVARTASNVRATRQRPWSSRSGKVAVSTNPTTKEVASTTGVGSSEEETSSGKVRKGTKKRVFGQGIGGANKYWTDLTRDRQNSISEVLHDFEVRGIKYDMVRRYTSRLLNQDLENRLLSKDDSIIIETIRTIVENEACAGPPGAFSGGKTPIERTMKRPWV